jgi:hypothetical protein
MLPMRVMAPPLGMSLAASRAQNQVPADQQWFDFGSREGESSGSTLGLAKGSRVSRSRDGQKGSEEDGWKREGVWCSRINVADSPITLMSMSFFTFSVGYSWATKFSTMPAAVTQDYG